MIRSCLSKLGACSVFSIILWGIATAVASAKAPTTSLANTKKAQEKEADSQIDFLNPQESSQE